MKIASFFRQVAVLVALIAGVSQSPAAQPPARWSLEASPALTLGQDEAVGNALLQVVVFATRLPDGSIMVGDRGEYTLKQFDKTGKFVRALGRKGAGPGEISWGTVRDGRPTGSRPLPLGKQPVVTIGRSSALVGTGDRFQFKAYGLNGRPLKPIERSGAPVALTKSDIRDAIDREVADDGEDRSKQVEASYASMTFPQVLPAYTQMLVDADDHLWVRPFPRGTGNLVSWSIFTPAGALVGEVAVPRHLEVFEIGRDYVLGRYMDPKEAIPEVRLYRLKRS